MTTNELMIKVKNELEARGFNVQSADGYTYQAWAEKDGKSEHRQVEGFKFTHLFGYDVRLAVVHRHNDTAENTSVDISIAEWSFSSGHHIASERVNTKMSDKSIANRVSKIAAIFETL